MEYFMSKTYQYDELVELAGSILRKKHGYSPDEAAITAKVLVEADARGIPSHGVSRLDFYLKNLQGGFCKPGAKPEVVYETPISLVVDGHDGVGPFITEFAVNKMLDKADKTGAAFCAVRNSNHFGIAGYWAERAAMRGMLGMAFTNTRPCSIPTFGRERVLGTNPIAVAIPLTTKPAGDSSGVFLPDFATSTVAHGKIEVYDRRKKPMPEGWAVDQNGKGMTDATAFEKLYYSDPRFGGHLFVGGEGETTGGHKGYGLGLLVEVLCAGFSLGTASRYTFTKGKGSGIAHFFGCWRLDLFGKAEDIEANVKAICDDIKSSEKATDQPRIYMHGEKEAEARAKAMKDGIVIDDPTVKLLQEMAK
jgi:LDH2 family malate/lactate/ureidoglycolate dehydrogenase